MALADLTSREAVLRALAEFDELGRTPFLSKYGFSKARSYFLVRDGVPYDSKAIAGVAHGYQHPEQGPLRRTDFSGGDATVRARLEALGFTVIVTEPGTGPTRALQLFEDYTRREVRDIFAPTDNFVAGAGTWGLSGIIEHLAGDFVLFVTFGREQGTHRFDEGITVDGVLTWQSQPNQSLADTQVQRLIDHDPERGNVRLFLRTASRAGGAPMSYTYLGRLKYLTHDTERERPVYFQWQLIDDWPPPDPMVTRMGLQLLVETPRPVPSSSDVLPSPALVESPPPAPPDRRGTRTADFRARKAPDWSEQDARNRHLGRAGELAVVVREQEWLRAHGRADLAELVRHVAVVEGDGTGYDVASFELDGSDRFIEVKTTRSGVQTEFFISANEVQFSIQQGTSYYLYRVYDFDPSVRRGQYYVRRGSLVDDVSLQLQPVQFRVRLGNRTE